MRQPEALDMLQTDAGAAEAAHLDEAHGELITCIVDAHAIAIATGIDQCDMAVPSTDQSNQLQVGGVDIERLPVDTGIDEDGGSGPGGIQDGLDRLPTVDEDGEPRLIGGLG